MAAPLSTELELPLADAPATPLAQQRLAHLRAAGLAEGEVVRLVRAYPSLAAVYRASHEELSRLIGSAAAARVRWFLDAPLDTRLAMEANTARIEPAAAPLRLPHAA